MRATVFTDADRFETLVRPLVRRDPAACSLLATTVRAAAAGFDLPGSRWFLVEDDDGPVCAAALTPPYPMSVTPVRSGTDLGTAMAALVDAVLAHAPTGVSGREAETAAFTEVWSGRTGRTAKPSMATILYELDRAPTVPDVDGAPRLGTTADADWIVPWFTAFHQEALHGHGHGPPDAETELRRRIARGALVVWERDGTPVAMAGVSTSIAEVSRIGGVYTPPAFRRRGFGAAATAVAAQHAFGQGAHVVMLYADAANPTSNGVYRSLGFRPTSRSQDYTLLRTPP